MSRLNHQEGRGEHQRVHDQPSSTNSTTSSVVYVGNLPGDWNEEVIESVVAGSGKIVDIRTRLDPMGKRSFCFVEYLNPIEAQNALKLLNEIRLGPKKKLRIELSKEGLRSGAQRDKPLLQLNRNFLPYYVQLPPAMRPDENYNNGGNGMNMNNNNNNYNNVKKEEPFPEILSKASTYLPAFNSSAFASDSTDKISENLKSIPPVQLIELLSTLKTMIPSDMNSVEQVFKMSNDIPVAVVQSMILMGLIDANVIAEAIQPQLQQQQPPPRPPLQQQPQQHYSQPPPPPPPAQFNQQQQQYNQFQQMPSAPSQPLSPWPTLPYQTQQKLLKLDPNEAQMISQVLLLSPMEISNFPPQQKQMVESIRSQYL